MTRTLTMSRRHGPGTEARTPARAISRGFATGWSKRASHLCQRVRAWLDQCGRKSRLTTEWTTNCSRVPFVYVGKNAIPAAWTLGCGMGNSYWPAIDDY